MHLIARKLRGPCLSLKAIIIGSPSPQALNRNSKKPAGLYDNVATFSGTRNVVDDA